MKIVVAGASGFLGTHLCRGALLRGHSVVGVSTQAPKPERRVDGVGYMTVDLRNEVPRFPMAPDVVINAAGYVLHPQLEKQAEGLAADHVSITRHLLRTMESSQGHFIQIGSGDEYESPGLAINEDEPAGGFGPYGRAKSSATSFVRLHAAEIDISFTILRPFLVYGPLQADNRFIPQLVGGLLHDRTVLVGSEERLRDFLYVDDFVEAVFSCLVGHKCKNAVLNVSSGLPTSIAQVAGTIQDMIGLGHISFGDRPSARIEHNILVGDSRRLRERTGWTPRTDLAIGLRKTIASMRSILHRPASC